MLALAPPVSDGSRENNFSGRLNPSQLWPSHVLVLESLIRNSSTFQSEVEKRFKKLRLLSRWFSPRSLHSQAVSRCSEPVGDTNITGHSFQEIYEIMFSPSSDLSQLFVSWWEMISKQVYIFPRYSFELRETRWICFLVQLQRQKSHLSQITEVHDMKDLGKVGREVKIIIHLLQRVCRCLRVYKRVDVVMEWALALYRLVFNSEQIN